ncbi:hypothetical protein ACFQ60_04205 [Streptomyces zhihengii]
MSSVILVIVVAALALLAGLAANRWLRPGWSLPTTTRAWRSRTSSARCLR